MASFLRTNYNLNHICIKSPNNTNLIKNIIEIYIKNKLRFNIIDENVELIHYVCKKSNLDIIKYVIDKYIENNLPINIKNIKGNEIIHITLNRNKPEIFKYVIEKYYELGLLINNKNIDGNDIIMIACDECYDIELFKYIINFYKKTKN